MRFIPPTVEPPRICHLSIIMTTFGMTVDNACGDITTMPALAALLLSTGSLACRCIPRAAFHSTTQLRLGPSMPQAYHRPLVVRLTAGLHCCTMTLHCGGNMPCSSKDTLPTGCHFIPYRLPRQHCAFFISDMPDSTSMLNVAVEHRAFCCLHCGSAKQHSNYTHGGLGLSAAGDGGENNGAGKSNQAWWWWDTRILPAFLCCACGGDRHCHETCAIGTDRFGPWFWTVDWTVTLV